jgi:hypothetical protein
MSFMVWLFVRIHMMNQNACLASCEDVLAALPTRATRDPMNGNHTALFNPERLAARYGCGAISHKVSLPVALLALTDAAY